MSTSVKQSANSLSPAVFDWPNIRTVSVIIPCYNEEKFIGKALANLAHQYASDHFEILVVDGMSTDHTRDVVNEFKAAHPELAVSLIDNPARTIPQALNLGIEAARGDIVARIDAHAAPSPGYLRRCVEILQKQKNAVVGMPCHVRASSDTSTAKAVALAVSHPFGIGDAKYRLSNDLLTGQTEVDTVAFACFEKSLWSELGGFDERLLTNEDYDFNYRARQRGNKVILDYSEHCDYFARPDLRSLANQYLRYGFWKAQMVKQQPRSLKTRHLVAPAFVGCIVILPILSFISSLALLVLLLTLGLYLSTAFYFAVQAGKDQSFAVALRLPLVFATIHVCWGLSFLFGLLQSPRG